MELAFQQQSEATTGTTQPSNNIVTECYEDFCLNVEKNLQKKALASKRDDIHVEKKRGQGGYVITLNSVYELYKQALRSCFASGATGNDLVGVVRIDVDATRKGHFRDVINVSKLGMPLFTINLFHTTSRMQINGKQPEIFLKKVLPVCDSLINKYLQIQGITIDQYKSSMQYALSQAMHGSNVEGAPQNKKPCPAASSKMIAHQGIIEDDGVESLMESQQKDEDIVTENHIEQTNEEVAPPIETNGLDQDEIEKDPIKETSHAQTPLKHVEEKEETVTEETVSIESDVTTDRNNHQEINKTQEETGSISGNEDSPPSQNSSEKQRKKQNPSSPEKSSQKKKRNRKRRKDRQNQKVTTQYCIKDCKYNRKETELISMIQCNLCFIWFHYPCTKDEPELLDKCMAYTCPSCRQITSKVQQLTSDMLIMSEKIEKFPNMTGIYKSLVKCARHIQSETQKQREVLKSLKEELKQQKTRYDNLLEEHKTLKTQLDTQCSEIKDQLRQICKNLSEPTPSQYNPTRQEYTDGHDDYSDDDSILSLLDHNLENVNTSKESSDQDALRAERGSYRSNNITSESYAEKVRRSPFQQEEVEYTSATRVQGHNDTLSNFYPCRLHFDGQTFRSSEAVYQYQRAMYHNMPDLAQTIRNSRHAGESKRLADQYIQDTVYWEYDKYEVMWNVLKLKVEQSQEFVKALLETNGSQLQHTVQDRYWGTGLKETSSSFPGENIFGNLLEHLRQRLLDRTAHKPSNNSYRNRNLNDHRYQPRCDFCSVTGHLKDTCHFGRPVQCYQCGYYGHKSSNCYYYSYY